MSYLVFVLLLHIVVCFFFFFFQAEDGIRDHCVTGVQTVCSSDLESASRVVESVINEFRNLKAAPVPEEELRRCKDQLKGSLMLSLESSTARMSNLARQEM